jgi:transmembrane protein TMEM260 (protein O-mannosyltransferase)
MAGGSNPTPALPGAGKGTDGPPQGTDGPPQGPVSPVTPLKERNDSLPAPGSGRVGPAHGRGPEGPPQEGPAQVGVGLPSSSVRQHTDPLVAAALALALFALYVVTLAPTALRSDSGEFQVMPWVLGVAHAPGYPLLTLLGRLAMLLPVGDPAYRLNLLDAAAAATAAGLVYLAVVELTRRAGPAAGRAGGLVGALLLGLGSLYWQQSLVGGPRPFIFFFTGLLFWLLFRWGYRRTRPALLALAFSAGLALTHHPNQAMLYPGLALYVIGSAPRLLLRPKLLLAALLAFGAPLLLYLYLPIRSAMNPPLGATNLADPRELLIYLTAANYQDAVLNNCGGSRLIQLQRYLVFFHLQFGVLAPLAALGGLFSLVWTPLAGLALLYAFLTNATFGICSSLAMPDYIIPSFVVAAIWFGAALAWPLHWLARLPLPRPRALPATLVGLVAVLLGLWWAVGAAPRLSMAGRDADARRAEAGMAQTRPAAVILSDWESITPLWYAQRVLGLNPGTKTALVTAPPGSDRWAVEVEQAGEDRPVVLAQRTPSLDGTFRAFPIGPLFEVQDGRVFEKSPVGLRWANRSIELLSYQIDRPGAAPGEPLHLTLYQRSVRIRPPDFWPVLRLASNPPVEFRFDGALHYGSNDWYDNEVVGEVYTFSLPAWLPPGPLPLELAYRVAGENAIFGLQDGQPWTYLTTLQVAPPRPARELAPDALASFGDQLQLRAGRANAAGQRVDLSGPADLALAPGTTLDLQLQWSAPRWLDESYTLFVHLLDEHGHLVVQRDALPLGGIYHTYKWVPGQVISDWYQLPLPPTLPPGSYTLEIGAYNSITTERLPLVDQHGAPVANSFRWGPLQVR